MAGMRWFLMVAVLVALALCQAPQAEAALTFGCTVRLNSTCLANETLLVRLNSSETGAAPNNSHAQLANYSGALYNWSVCCWTDSFRAMNNTCTGTYTPVLRLNETTNSHVEAGNMSTALYPYQACLNLTGTLSCTYRNTACTGTYISILSMASSETADANLTNAHLALPTYYLRQVCCAVVNTPPTVDSLVVNSTFGTNSTAQNLTAYATASDIDQDTISYPLMYDWRVNGTSIAALNTNFDVNNSGGTGRTNDASSYGNDPYVVRARWNATAGYNGTGAYVFNGSDGTADALTYGHASLDIGTGNITVMAWVKYSGVMSELSAGTRLSAVAGRGFLGGSLTGYGIFTRNESLAFQVRNDTESYGVWPEALTPFNDSSWHHVAGVFERTSPTVIRIYIDGVLVNTSTETDFTGQTLNSGVNFSIASRPHNAGNYGFNFTGTIDDVRVYNRALSAEQIMLIYQNRSHVIDDDETQVGQNWTACVIANDAQNDSATSCSTGLLIVGKTPPSNVTLLWPYNGNTSVFERYVNFSWSPAIEVDGDQVNYTLNLTVTAGACSLQTTQSNIQTTNYTYGPLCVDQIYWWNVTACDVEGCSAASQTFNFTIASVLNLNLTSNNTDFGSIAAGASNTTDDYSPYPFLIENIGNVFANISIVGNSSPYTSVGLDNAAFQYKAQANETGSINASASTTSYTPVPGAFTPFIVQLNYTDVSDIVAIHINITVPSDEPPGTKQANVTFRGEVSIVP